MALLETKCPNCNAPLKDDSNLNNEKITCEYCRSTFTKPNAKPNTETPPAAAPIKPVSLATKITDTIGSTINDIFYSRPVPKPPTQATPSKIRIPPRPRVNLILLVLLLCCYVMPGIFYFLCVRSSQHRWDKKYGNY